MPDITQEDLIMLRQMHKQMAEFNQLLKGSTTLDTEGLIKRQKIDEIERHRQKEQDIEYRQIIEKRFSQMDLLLKESLTNLGDKISTSITNLKEDFEKRIKPMEAFNTRLEAYFDLLTNRWAWKILIGGTVCFLIIISWSKGGYEIALKYIKAWAKP